MGFKVPLVSMAPKMKLPQRRKLVRGLEEDARRKRMAVEPSPAQTLALGPIPASSPSSITPSKVPLFDRRVEPRKNIDFKFFENEGFSIGFKIKN